MKPTRLSELFALKYKIAIDVTKQEQDLKAQVHLLWDYVNKQFNILKVCAETSASKPQNDNEKKAVEGFKFCRELVGMIDYLKINIKTISLPELRELIINIIKLIDKNKGDDGVQFSNVSELIFQLFKINKKHDFKLRNESQAKARTGLSRIFSVSTNILKDLRELEIMVPEKFQYKNKTNIDIDADFPERFTPQRAMLSEYDIIDFIRQHGDKYGISSKEDWAVALRNDPQLKEQMTTVINALNRGHNPQGGFDVKHQINEILTAYKERAATNAEEFEENK